jgi:MFS transporter, PPP family, 3-phenylpropionic acid transporter
MIAPRFPIPGIPGGTIKLIRPFLFYVLLYAAYASAMPYIVVYYQGLGFSGSQIGVLTGLSPLITFFGAPLWTRLADSTRRHRLIMSLTMLAGIAAVTVMPLLRAFAPILVTALSMSFFLAPASSFGDNSTMHTLGDRKALYGRIRIGGSIGFALAAPIVGYVIQIEGLRIAFWIAAGLYFLAMLVSWNFDHGVRDDQPAASGGVAALLSNPRWLVFLGIAFAGGLAMTASNNYLFPLMTQLGAKTSLMGFALSVGTFLEYPVLFFGNHLIRWFKPFGLYIFAMVLTAVRLLLFGWNTSPDLILLIQLLNGLSFAAMWMAGVAFAHEHAPAGLTTTAQGLFAAMVFGIGSATGGFIGGPLLETVGGRGLFLAYGIVVSVFVAAGAVLYRLLPKETPAASAPETSA